MVCRGAVLLELSCKQKAVDGTGSISSWILSRLGKEGDSVRHNAADVAHHRRFCCKIAEAYANNGNAKWRLGGGNNQQQSTCIEAFLTDSAIHADLL